MTLDGGDESDFLINPAGIVARGVAEGLSANQISKSLRDNGAGLRRSTVLKLVGEVRAAIANRESVASMPTNRLPTGDEYARWVTNRRGYSTQLKVITRDKATGLIGSTVSSYTTTQQHTIDEAIANTVADWEDLTGSEGQYEDQQLLGVLPWNIFEMGPE